AACWTGDVPPPAPVMPAPKPAPPPFQITVERTGCLGMCPTYQVAINGPGIVTWHGEANVAAIGDRSGHVTRGQLTEIAAKVDEIGFFDYDEYGQKPDPAVCTTQGNTTTCSIRSFTICTDTSHVVITVRRGSLEHRVDDPRCGESKIEELGRLVDRFANTERWIRGEERFLCGGDATDGLGGARRRGV